MPQKDERRELLDRFLDETRRDPSSAYFTEDELVEIFDYANDFDDEFTRSEVLMFGAARYPDSEELRVRRALHYFYAGVAPDKVMDVLRHVPESNVLAAILKVQLHEGLSPSEQEKALDAVVDSVTDFADEEVLQLIDIAADMGHLDWLERNAERIAGKCSYKPTCFFELGEVFSEAGKYDRAVNYFDALTEIDPFDMSFWNRLTEAAGMANDYERALQSSEFALALAPEDVDARFLKARALFALKREPDEIISLLEPIALPLVKERKFFHAALMLASVHSALRHDNDKAIEILAATNDLLPSEQEPLSALIQLDGPDLVGRLRRFHEASPEMTAQAWSDWATELIQMGPHMRPGALLVMETYFANNILHPLASNLFAWLYIGGQYDKVDSYGEIYDRAIREAGSDTFPPRDIFMARFMAMLRNKKRHTSHEAITWMIKTFEQFPPVFNDLEDRLSYEGLRLAFIKVLEFLDKHPNFRPSSLDKVDPFIGSKRQDEPAE